MFLFLQTFCKVGGYFHFGNNHMSTFALYGLLIAIVEVFYNTKFYGLR